MRHAICHLFFICLLLPSWGVASPVSKTGQEHSAVAVAASQVMVVEFGEASPPGSKFALSLEQAKKEINGVRSLVMPDAQALKDWLEKKADNNVGMVVLVHPEMSEIIASLPSLYPDISFTLIDPSDPLYGANVQNIVFKEQEGVFLLGAIAAIRTSGPLAIVALEDTPHHHAIAEDFSAGAKHIRPNVVLRPRLDIAKDGASGKALLDDIGKMFQEGATLVFSMDPAITEQALHAAKQERNLVVSMSEPALGGDDSRLLTYLVKRYDLALLDMLRILGRHQWHAGSIHLGVSGGYVDYALTTDNVEIFPKDAIDQIEALKDYTGQGLNRPTTGIRE